MPAETDILTGGYPLYTYYRIALPNGLRLILVQMPHLHSALICTFTRVGPRFERPHERGISHFVEHTLFNGSQRYPTQRDLFGAVEDIGGEFNAVSSYEHAMFWLKTHSDHVGEGLRIFADFFNQPTFNDDSIEQERKIILEELHGTTQQTLPVVMQNLLWPEGSELFNAIGDIENIEGFTRDDLVAHFHRWYVPENMVLCLAGKFDLAEAERLSEELFGGLGGIRDPYEVALPAPDPGPLWHSQPWGGTQTSFALSHLGVSYLDERKTPLRIASVLLGGGPRSVLFEALRERLGLTYHISADVLMTSDFGTLDVYCSVLHENLAQALSAVLDEIYCVMDQGIEGETLARIKERVRCWMEYKLDSPEEMVNWFGLGDLLLGHERVETPEAHVERVRNTTADEVLELMCQVFRPDRRYLAVLGTEGQLLRKREIGRLLEMHK
jgi:predicted Zn-dependent peptidase